MCDNVTVMYSAEFFRRWQWVNRKVHRSSSVTGTINISPRLGFSLRRLEAMTGCRRCITTASKQGESKVAPAPSYLSSEIMFPENFYTITGDSEASNWVLQFLHPRQCNSAVPSDSSTRTHTHNRSVSILISLAQFDRSLNLAAS